MPKKSTYDNDDVLTLIHTKSKISKITCALTSFSSKNKIRKTHHCCVIEMKEIFASVNILR